MFKMNKKELKLVKSSFTNVMYGKEGRISYRGGWSKSVIYVFSIINCNLSNKNKWDYVHTLTKTNCLLVCVWRKVNIILLLQCSFKLIVFWYYLYYYV